ncbi:MAG: transposase, partial [Deltaproteobacteria bacterium]|nr:transposase [Deltaproteobacteria bacterium]
YTNQEAKVRDGFLRLPHGRGQGVLRVKIPEGMTLPGRILEATLTFGMVRLVCEVADEETVPTGVIVGVDLGVNTLLAATDGGTAVVVSGREAKAIQQYRNKQLASLRSRLDRCKPGSRRHKRLQRRKHKHLARCARKQRDLCHKATRAVARAFPGARVVVGKPFNAAAQRLGRRQAQQVSQACTAKIIQQLGYKLSGATEVSEAYSSQTCPVCGCGHKCLRIYRCKGCGLVAPRDVVGATNIRAIGLYGVLAPAQPMAKVLRFVRPLQKYPGREGQPKPPGSSGGTPARSSLAPA